MKYQGCANGIETELSIEKEGIRLGSSFLDYADVVSICPINHRVFIETLPGTNPLPASSASSDEQLGQFGPNEQLGPNEQIEISMLGFSFDGFWEELTDLYGKRSLESLFVDEQQIMLCEGEYVLPQESGRCLIALYPDSVCILPPTRRAARIPLCYTQEILLDGYMIHLRMRSGMEYTVGKMGYDTMPFYERTIQAADRTKKKRAAALSSLPLNKPFTVKGLFRTEQPDQYWNAAFGASAGSQTCAVELYTGDDAATYLYRFEEPPQVFLQRLEEAMEAMGTHREIIYLDNDQLLQKPLYLMTVERTDAVLFLRERSDGRLIHSGNHMQKLTAFLGL